MTGRAPPAERTTKRWATVGRVEELAQLGEFARLRDLGVPEDELGEVAEAAAARPAARANPRPAPAPEIEELLRSVW